MIRQKSGRIINVSGLAARQTGTIIGSMRNVSVSALTKNLADELSPHGISAVCVHPGLTRTEKTPGVVAAQAKAQGVAEAEIEKRMAGRNLTRKIITAEEIAHIVTFLASPSRWPSTDVTAAGGGAPGAIHYDRTRDPCPRSSAYRQTRLRRDARVRGKPSNEHRARSAPH
jgi:NAD(P)-dependent dehydrogenase (short-subunit alcohol dehydrogenase family)